MQDDGNSSDRPETPVSWLESDKPPQAEAEVNDQENYEWDNYFEDPSYLDLNLSSPLEAQEQEKDTRRQSSTDNQLLEASPRHVVQPFIFARDSAEPYATWPPRNPSSEPEFFAENLLPAGLLDAVNESEEDEVFFDLNIENTMPPKTPPNPAQLYLDFKKQVTAWDLYYDLAIQLGDDLPNDTMEDLTKRCKSIDKLCQDIQELESNYAASFPDMSSSRNKVFLERARLQSSFDKRIRANQNAPVEVRKHPEEEVDKAVEDSKSKLTILIEKVNSAEEDMLKIFSDSPTPSEQDASDIRALLDKLNEAKDSLHTHTIKLGLEAAKYQEASKAAALKLAADDNWKSVKDRIIQLQRKGREYCSKAEPAPPPPHLTRNTSAPVRSTPLERLPLPTFKGTKMEYLRFKQDFQNHVKYETEGEKMLALKTKCLIKGADKQRIANMMSLNECWEKLDEEYGDIATLVAEVFATWENLKPPTNDSQFIKFVESIENGVSCLKALGHEKDMDSTYSAVMLEKKLSERLKQEYSKSFVSDTDPSRNRMQTLLSFLKLEKRACHLRTSNYASPGKKNDNSDDNSVATNLTGTNQVRGGKGGGRGQGRGKGQQGQGRSKEKPEQEDGKGKGGKNGRGGGRGAVRQQKRGEPNTKCVVCDNDHASSKCSTWRDENNSKAELHYLASESLSQPFCLWCLEPGHYNSRCYSTEEYGCPCESGVNKFLCCKTDDCKSRKNWKKTSSSTTTIASTASSLTIVNGVQMGEALLPIQMIPLSNFDADLRVMFDNCSQSTFILTKTAQRLGLKGILIHYILICTDGSKKKMKGYLYHLSLRDITGEKHEFEAVGIDKLSSSYSGLKVIGIKKKLKYLPNFRSLSDEKLTREGGELDLLIGSDLAQLHPKGVTDIDQLTIMRSKFSTGWTLMGHHKELVQLTSEDKGVKVNVCAVEKIKVAELFDNQIKSNMAGTKDLQFLDAVSTESIGVNVPPKCSSCKAKTENCKECKLKTEMMTYLEFLQDQQINEDIEYLPDKKRYIASYPYTKEIFNLLPNKEIALKRAKNLEENLLKRPADIQLLNQSLFDSFERGVFRYLTNEEIENWSGQVHYIPMNRVYKESESTPVRLVFDSGQPDKNGRSLNGCMGKGKNPLNHFGSIVLNFRAAEQVACGDIKKMFNQIAVREEDQQLRRFFIRPDGIAGKEPFKEAVITCINFGEKAAGGVATAVKDRCADDNQDISPKVAAMIKDKCFMDDINVDAKYTENLDVNISKAEEILENGGFEFKKWNRSGDAGEKELGKSETGVTKSLGMSWKTENDKLVYRVKLNFSKKARNRYSGKNTTLETLKDDFPKKMTKRLALKLNHTIFDPAMLIQPWIQKLRLSFRDILIFERENGLSGWDAELPEKFRSEWLQLTLEMFDLETLEFNRSIVPRNYDPSKKPTLVMYSDGSDKGQCVVAYLVWEMLVGELNFVSLITSRTKIASMTKMTTPRSELNAAQLQSRLKAWLHSTLDLELADTLHVVDASIILGMITNISLKFDTYTAPRVTEIQTNTNIESWFWIETQENPSDLGTRGKVSVKDLSDGSMWREGPAWMKSPRSTWPLRSDFRKHEVPGLKKEFEVLRCATNLTQLIDLNDVFDEKEKETIASSATNAESEPVETCTFPEAELEIDISNEIDFTRYSSWFKLVEVSVHVLILGSKLLNQYKLGIKVIPTYSGAQKIVKQMWFRSMMKETKEMLKTTKLTGLLVFEKEGIVSVTTRSKQENWNPENLVVLSPKHPLTRLILRSMHEVDHRGVMHTVARSRIFYWIPQASKLVRKIKNNCFRCRIKDAEAMRQLMAPLPAFRLKSSPVWHFSMIDLFGPINVKDFVNQRTTRKTWAVVITCLTTRACQTYLAESFSTDHLLCVLSKHEARNGSPAEYFADLGRQIVGADRILTEAVEKLDQKMIERFAASNESKFNFGTPHFPEGQGAVERLVQEVKKGLKVLTNNDTLSFGELDTALAEASYLVNTRPLQPNPAMGEDGFICPNDIIMGRSDKAPPLGDIFDNKLTRRVSHMRRLVDEFWKKWSLSYYQSLVKYHKWRLRERNAEPGDVVLVLDREGPKGKFTLGQIDSVKTDPDNVVRKVTIKYKLAQKGDTPDLVPMHYKYAERNVRGLALVVTAQERKEIESIDLDDLRFNKQVENVSNNSDDESNPEESSNDDQEDENDDQLQDATEEIAATYDATTVEDDLGLETTEILPDQSRMLPPTSKGRKRLKPKKLDL